MTSVLRGPTMDKRFFNLYSHDFARVAVGTPRCRVADPAFNARETIALARQAQEQGAVLAAFPELGLSAYTCDDLFHQRALLEGCIAALAEVVEASSTLPLALIVGLPLRVDHVLFNCAAVIANGRILGVVPKSYLPNYGEFYESRQFSPSDNAVAERITLLGQDVPFGAKQLFEIENLPLLRFHVEICEDVWVPIPPSSYAALAGATVLVNLSASNVVVGKSGYRHQLVSRQSARRALHRGLQHPGAGPGPAPAGVRPPEGRDRRVRRPRLHARAAGLRQGDGPPGPAARQHPGLHDAGLRDQRAHAAPGARADVGGWLQRSRDRHRP